MFRKVKIYLTRLPFSFGISIFLSFLVAFFSIQNAFAAGDAGNVKISNVHIEAQYDAFIWVTPSVANPDGCGNVTVVAVNDQDPLYSQKMSVILTAFAAGKTVDFWLIGCVGTPWGYTVPYVHSVTAFAQ